MALTLDGTNGIVSSGSITTQSATGVIFSDSSNQGAAASPFSLKNRIINGDMVIAQRGTSFTTPASNAYNLDRWLLQWAGAAPATVAQVSGPSTFKNAIRITGAASNTAINFQQRIESFNCSDLSGATVTIQVNIATSSSQTVLWVLQHANAQDNWSSATNISSGTWSATSTATTFTATITGLPSGATNGLLLAILPNNGGAFTSGTITITGVQLERNTTATPFEWIPYGQELMLCQRYFWKPNNAFLMQGITSNRIATNIFYPAQMRVNPTLSLSTTTPYWESVPYNTVGSITSGAAEGSKLTSMGGLMSFVGTFGTTPVQSYPGLFGTGTEITFSAEL